MSEAMPVRRGRLTTLDDFLAAAKELARRTREEGVDTETLIARVAEEAARRAAAAANPRLSDEDVARIARVVSEAVAATISKMLEERLAAINAGLKSLAEQLERLREEVRLAKSSGGGSVRSEERLPAWARKLAKLLESSPYVRLHEVGVDTMLVKNPEILSKLDAVVVETSKGVYMLRRRAWEELLERLRGVKVRDEEEAVRTAGQYAEIVMALMRDNLLYYNNGWRVLRDAFYAP